MSRVLVTGGSGFIAGYTILRLLRDGHDVRTTVRTAARADVVRTMLRDGGAEDVERVAFAIADLERDDGWDDAVAGCDAVLHLASPFPAGIPKDENELIVPARDGALRVLRAARDARVRRVVLTSSFAAIGYGHAPQTAPFDETDWTDLAGRGLTAYVKSKTIAERAAWDFVAREGGGLQLATINPTGVFGPVLGPDISTSILLVKRMLDGTLPGLPRLRFGVVDVRDVADIHVLAMDAPAAAGERFLAVSGDFMSLLEMATVLRGRLGAAAARVPTREVPDWLVRLSSLRDPAARQIVPELGTRKNATAAKARQILGWSPRPREEALVATAESLLRRS